MTAKGHEAGFQSAGYFVKIQAKTLTYTFFNVYTSKILFKSLREGKQHMAQELKLCFQETHLPWQLPKQNRKPAMV